MERIRFINPYDLEALSQAELRQESSAQSYKRLMKKASPEEKDCWDRRPDGTIPKVLPFESA